MRRESFSSESFSAYAIHSSTIVFEIDPIDSIFTVTTSPGFKKHGGFMPAPTPLGVPVAITSPGNNVPPIDKSSISSGIEYSISVVLPRCRNSSFTYVSIRRSGYWLSLLLLPLFKFSCSRIWGPNQRYHNWRHGYHATEQLNTLTIFITVYSTNYIAGRRSSPRGKNPSNDFPILNCWCRFCRSLAVMSLQIVYP